jgi:hypothetical protein
MKMLGCGCLGAFGLLLVVGVIAVVVLLPRLPEIAASVIGMRSEGQTNEVFVQATAPPPVALQNPVEPAQVTVNLGSYGGSQTLTTDNPAYDVTVGSDDTGRETAIVSFSEAGLMDICRQQRPECNGSDPRFQNVRIDLKPGGAIIFADVSVPTGYGFDLQQTAGVVLQLDSSGRQFQFTGIDLNGSLYSNPPAELASTVQQFEQVGNDVLNQVSINAGGGMLALQRAQIDETTMTLIMQ